MSLALSIHQGKSIEPQYLQYIKPNNYDRTDSKNPSIPDSHYNDMEKQKPNKKANV